MKAEYTLFCGYAAELAVDNKYLTAEDYKRTERSIQSKGIGFVRDLDELCNDLRLALSTGYFELSEHTSKVFTRAQRSVLPRFLLGSLSRIFEPSGILREDFCQDTVATLISFLSSLKRITPSGDTSDLQQKVWSSLRSSFQDSHHAVSNFFEAIKSDSEFAYIIEQARLRFREYMDCDIEADLYFGPGANLDRMPSEGKMNWLLDVPESTFGSDDELRSLYRKLRDQANYAPFRDFYSTYKRGGKRHAYGIRSKGIRTLRRFDNTMKCSAQPKSYKAFRGVGVMSATRMAMQLSLQKTFYRRKLTEHLPLNDAAEMERNLRTNFEYVGTIDLSSASDRLYWPILRHMGHDVPFFEACYRLRTRSLVLPDGEVHCASPVMGEAITFVLMSSFFAAVALAVCDYYGWGHEMVRVYGDDIMTPHYEETIRVLELCGAKVSVTKSYPPISRFKESCEAHYVSSFETSLRYCRPAYIPSGDINDRGRIHHGYAHILLTIAHDAYRVCTKFAKSICDFVEQHTGLELPLVFAGSYHLGRVSQTTEDYRTLYVSHKCTPSAVSFSTQGRIRQHLYSTRPVSFDPKVHAKQERRLMSSSTKRIQMRDDLNKLEAHVLLCCLRRWYPDDYEKVKAWKHDRLRSYCISTVSAERFSEMVDEIIGKLGLV